MPDGRDARAKTGRLEIPTGSKTGNAAWLKILPEQITAESEALKSLGEADAETIARAHLLRGAMGLPGGQLVANPIPASDEIPAPDLAPVIAAAQAEADAQGIAGKAVTPFLLQRIFEATEGRSLTANIALVRNNARLAAEIAKALNKQAQSLKS